jgi:hypothetical protein
MAVRGLSTLDQEEPFSSAHTVVASLGGRVAQTIAIAPGSDPIADVDVLNRRRPCRRSGRLGGARLGRRATGGPPGLIDWQVRAMRAVGSPGWGSKRVPALTGQPATTTGSPTRRGEPLIRPCHICPTASDLRGCRHSELSDASPNHPGIFKEWSPMSDMARDPTERAGITGGCPATTIPRQGSAAPRQPPALLPCGYGLPCLVWSSAQPSRSGCT